MNNSATSAIAIVALVFICGLILVLGFITDRGTIRELESRVQYQVVQVPKSTPT
jgi:hypothetical protein